MKLVILILVTKTCFCFDVPATSCKSDLSIDNDKYNISETYLTDGGYPTDAHFDDNGNIFYIEAGSNFNGYYFNARIIPLNSTTPQNIPGLPDGISYSIAIDKNNKKVYFSTGDGIFSYDYETQKAKLVSKPTAKFNMISIDKDGNKYVTKNVDGIEEVYLLVGESKIRFKTLEALDEMAIDNKNNFYFIRDEKLFVLKSTLSMPIVLGNVTYDGMAQISFYKERVFVASSNLTYFHENDTRFMKIINNIPEKVSAIAFDKDGNFVLGLLGKLLHYKKHQCYLRND
ncbi:hypothetical protein RR48_07838 [Papilio machaon]|uniref:Ommochrome-binding protein n=1 Tax=Papilio machaon TaxID=76193 RepID=A0A194QTC6_PAPMA|nr:hypothetical protein RR48_07838 [Papilio machaon]